MSLNLLPNELLNLIGLKLEFKDLLNFLLVNKKLNDVEFWRSEGAVPP